MRKDAATKTLITIQTSAGNKRIEAEIYGLLALHERPGYSDVWNITHTPTGRSFGLLGCCNREIAIARIQALLKRSDLLQFYKGAPPTELIELAKKIKVEIK